VYTNQHKYSTVSGLSTPILRRVRRIEGPVRLEFTILIYVTVEVNPRAYIDSPPERADRSSNIRILMNVNEFFVL
jgi:hypothetical protein